MSWLFYFEIVTIIQRGAWGSKTSVNQFLNDHKKNLYDDKKTYRIFYLR